MRKHYNRLLVEICWVPHPTGRLERLASVIRDQGEDQADNVPPPKTISRSQLKPAIDSAARKAI